MTTNNDMWKQFEELDSGQFDDTLKAAMGDLFDLLKAKRASYGPGNLTEFGDFGVLVRTSDKLKRLVHMHREGIDVTAVNESSEDAWRDIAGYALLVLVAHRLKGDLDG